MFTDPAANASYPTSQPPRKARKRHKPIARITSYDYNVQFDLRRKQEVRNGRANQTGLFSSPIRPESYNVMEGELLVSIDKSQAYRDGQLHCFSFANGLGAFIPQALKTALMNRQEEAKQKAAKALTRFLILDRLTYVGVAVTGFDASHDRFQDMTQGFVATFGGLNTIINTGKKEIRPGDWISLGLPHQFKWEDDPYNKSKQAEGIPLDKLLFSTDVVTPASEAEKVQEIVQAYIEVGPNGRAAMADSSMPVALKTLKEVLTEAVLGNDEARARRNAEVALAGMIGGINATKLTQQKFMHLVTSIMHATQKMIIGIALSFGRPGEPFDICLGGSNSL